MASPQQRQSARRTRGDTLTRLALKWRTVPKAHRGRYMTAMWKLAGSMVGHEGFEPPSDAWAEVAIQRALRSRRDAGTDHHG